MHCTGYVLLCYAVEREHYHGVLQLLAAALWRGTILPSVMQFALLRTDLGGAQPIASYNFGAGNAGRVKKSFRLLLTASMIDSVVLWAGVIAFPRLFAQIFSSDSTLIDFTAHDLRLCCGARFIFGAQTACQMPFISTGNALSSIIVAVLRKFLLLIPLIDLMPHLMGDQTTAVYLAELVADGLAVIFTVTLFRYQFRKSLRSMEHQIGGIPEKRTPAGPDRTAGVQPVPKGCAPFYRALRRHSSFCR